MSVSSTWNDHQLDNLRVVEARERTTILVFFGGESGPKNLAQPYTAREKEHKKDSLNAQDRHHHLNFTLPEKQHYPSEQ